MHTTGDFILHGGDKAFTNRQKLLFDKLSDAEEECNKKKIINKCEDVRAVDVSNESKFVRVGQKHKMEMRRFRGKESIFKRPEGPAPRALNRNIPDFHKNPHKWKRYSLDDVSNDDMTEESNRRAALSFMKELKARRSVEKMHVVASGSVERDQSQITFNSKKIKTCTEIKFKRPTNLKRSNTENMDNVPIIIENDDRPVFRNSKVVMPEYIVGQKQKKKNKREMQFVKVDRLKQLKLGHLEEPDEEEEC